MCAKAWQSLAFFQATNAKAGMKCRISPAWPLSLAGWENGFSAAENMDTTMLLNFSLMSNSAYASFSIAQIWAALPGPSFFLLPGGEGPSMQDRSCQPSCSPKSKVWRTSKHALYSGNPPGIVKRVWLVQGLSFKPWKLFSCHPGLSVKSYGKNTRPTHLLPCLLGFWWLAPCPLVFFPQRSHVRLLDCFPKVCLWQVAFFQACNGVLCFLVQLQPLGGQGKSCFRTILLLFFRFLLPPPGFPAWPSFGPGVCCFSSGFSSSSFSSSPAPGSWPSFRPSALCCLFLNLLLRFSIALGGVFLASLSRFLAFFQAFCMGFLFRCACFRFSIALGGVFLASLSRFLPFFQAFCMGFLFRCACFSLASLQAPFGSCLFFPRSCFRVLNKKWLPAKGVVFDLVGNKLCVNTSCWLGFGLLDFALWIRCEFAVNSL